LLFFRFEEAGDLLPELLVLPDRFTDGNRTNVFFEKENDEDLGTTEFEAGIVANNDTLLFEVLYDRYAGLVYNKCYGFARDEHEAKDLTQDVFLKLFVKLASFKGKSKFSTWLYSFTYNHCVNYVTRNTAKKFEKQAVDYKDIENLSEDNEDDDKSFLSMKVDKLAKDKLISVYNENDK